MKSLFKNKKMTVIISLLIIAISVGVTYSWFTSTSAAATTGPVLGRLVIDSELDIDDAEVLYEPGLSKEVTGKVSNAGSLPFIAKIDLTSLTTIRSDGEGVPLKEEDYYQLSDVNGIDARLNQKILGFKDGPDNAMMAWLVDNEGNYYLVIDGTMDADIAFDVSFDGSLGNVFQGASVSLSSEWLATQVNSNAILDVLGVDYNDLEMINNDLSEGGYGRSAGSSYERIQARLDELFAR